MKRNRFQVETIITTLRETEVHLSKRNDYGLAYRPAISEKNRGETYNFATIWSKGYNQILYSDR